MIVIIRPVSDVIIVVMLNSRLVLHPSEQVEERRVETLICVIALAEEVHGFRSTAHLDIEGDKRVDHPSC